LTKSLLSLFLSSWQKARIQRSSTDWSVKVLLAL
jgi:hypothetical protein